MQNKKFLISLFSMLLVSLTTYLLQTITDHLYLELNNDFSISGSSRYRVAEGSRTYFIIIPMFAVVGVFVWELFFEGLKETNAFWNYFFCALSFFLVAFLFLSFFGNPMTDDGYTAKFFAFNALTGGLYPLLQNKLRRRFLPLSQ